MRIHRHDVRDMSLAFGLAFDLRRVSHAGVALCWTLVVLIGLAAILSWRTSAGALTPEGIYTAAVSLMYSEWTPLKLLLVTCMGCAWWVGFAYLCAPIQRSAALDIARDERERTSDIPLLNRQAAFGPLLVGVAPLAAMLALIVWSFLAYIPGTAGTVLVTASLPVVLLVAVPASAFLIVGVLAAPMMGPTAVVEGRDHLETVSRPMSYVLQRPGRYACYLAAKLGVTLASALAGAVVLGVAWAMVGGALWITGQGEFAELCARQALADPEILEVSNTAMGVAVVFWGSVFLLAAWLMVVGLACDTITYLLMRYRVDGITFDKITVAEERLAASPTAVETAEEAEEARKRFDEQEGEAAEVKAGKAIDSV